MRKIKNAIRKWLGIETAIDNMWREIRAYFASSDEVLRRFSLEDKHMNDEIEYSVKSIRALLDYFDLRIQQVKEPGPKLEPTLKPMRQVYKLFKR